MPMTSELGMQDEVRQDVEKQQHRLFMAAMSVRPLAP